MSVLVDSGAAHHCVDAVAIGQGGGQRFEVNERGTFGAGLQITYKRNMDRLIALCRTVQRNGRPAAEDPVIRQKLAQCYAEVEIMRANQMRAFSRISATGVPGPEGSIQKIFWSELNQRLQQIAIGGFVQ
jgi:alkylation response protein AidB-like acyl-CoA dehydrogenase